MVRWQQDRGESSRGDKSERNISGDCGERGGLHVPSECWNIYTRLMIIGGC